MEYSITNLFLSKRTSLKMLLKQNINIDKNVNRVSISHSKKAFLISNKGESHGGIF